MAMLQADMARIDGEVPLVSGARPSGAQLGVAAGIVLVLGAAVLAVRPFAHMPLPGSAMLVPAYAAANCIVELLTTALLVGLYMIRRRRALLVLALGYGFVGLLIVPWALTFPGVFAPEGLLGANLQSTALIAAVRRVSFPLFVLGYLLLKDEAARPTRWSLFALGMAMALLFTALAGFVTWVAVGGLGDVPAFMTSATVAGPLWATVPHVTMALYAVALAGLVWRRRTSLDLWLIVVLATLAIELVLLSYVSAGERLGVGWWTGRVLGLLATSTVLLAMIMEAMNMHVRLLQANLLERRAREERLATMQALLALVAHEVNQPLSSIVTSAGAGLRWIDRAEPGLPQARAALERIARDGHRAGRVIDALRDLFTKGPQERVSTDLNAVVHAAVAQSRAELRLHAIQLELNLSPHLPCAIGSPVQLQQAVSNLIRNAIDAMAEVRGRARVLRVATAAPRGDSLEVSVADTGTGVPDEARETIFQPFHSSKPHGMGMGLLFCRSIVEAHGGRLWVEENHPHGAIFRFTLLHANTYQEPAGAAHDAEL